MADKRAGRAPEPPRRSGTRITVDLGPEYDTLHALRREVGGPYAELLRSMIEFFGDPAQSAAKRRLFDMVRARPGR